MKTITTYDITQWLTTQIEAKRLQNISLTIEEHNDGVDDMLQNFSASDYIHIGAKGIRYIAEMLDLPIYVRSRKSDAENPYEISIVYKGERFVGIETEKDYNERGAVV